MVWKDRNDGCGVSWRGSRGLLIVGFAIRVRLMRKSCVIVDGNPVFFCNFGCREVAKGGVVSAVVRRIGNAAPGLLLERFCLFSFVRVAMQGPLNLIGNRLKIVIFLVWHREPVRFLCICALPGEGLVRRGFKKGREGER